VSGADLIGEVPPHWSVKPLRLIGRLLKGTGGSKEDVVEIGVPCVRYGDLYTTHNNFIEQARTYLTEDRAQDYTPIEYGDVLFAASGETIEEIGKSAVNLLHDARCGGDVVIFRPTKPSIARFFGYAMDAAPVAAQKSLAGRGTTVKHIYPDELREVVIAVPPVGEQQVIADYLDRETARLDALVAAKERVLGLLAEKRRALITRAVTRGLDPRAPLRDAGIPWLGEIPAHWKVLPLKYGFSRIGSGTTPPTGSANYYDGDVPWVTTSELRENVVTSTNESVTQEALSALSSLRTYPTGSLLFAMYGATIGRIAVLGVEATVNQAVCVLADATSFETWFTFFSLQASREHLIVQASGAGQPNLNAEIVRNHRIACPPLQTQETIVEYIVAESVKSDALRSATERTIGLLKERRAALIAAAVTGQMDIGAIA